jgi:hypothetical protein
MKARGVARKYSFFHAPKLPENTTRRQRERGKLAMVEFIAIAALSASAATVACLMLRALFR